MAYHDKPKKVIIMPQLWFILVIDRKSWKQKYKKQFEKEQRRFPGTIHWVTDGKWWIGKCWTQPES